MDLGKAGTGDVNTQLCTLYGELVRFCRQNSLNLHMSSLTRTLVNLPKDSAYPCGCYDQTEHRSVICFDKLSLAVFSFHRGVGESLFVKFLK